MSLRLRLPRGRPPAVGIDSSFFNLTPPSVEAVTPTNEEIKPVISESVETSIKVEAKETKDDTTVNPEIVKIPETEKSVIRNGTEKVMSNESEIPSSLELEKSVSSNIQKPEYFSPRKVEPTSTDNLVPTDTEKPISTQGYVPDNVEGEQTATDSVTYQFTNDQGAERFVKAEPLDINPNLHS